MYLVQLILGLGGLILSMSALGCHAPSTNPVTEALPQPNIKLTKLTDGFDFSVKMALLPNGAFVVTEKSTGFVRWVAPTFQLRQQPVVDVAVNHASERGLLGIAAHPDFAQQPYVYISYVASGSGRDSDDSKDVSDIRIVRFKLRADGTAGTLETIITLPVHPGPYHNGGCILFGPDGKLYVSLGELNRNANIISQLRSNPRGKILRYNDDGTIPADNPFGETNPIYVYGLRNSFGFDFKLQRRGLYISDNGPKGHDKLSVALPGENLGWPFIWGVADQWYERLAARFIGEHYRHPMWETFAHHMAPTAVRVVPNDFYGTPMKGRLLMGGFVDPRLIQFSLDQATRTQVIAQGTFLESLPSIVDLQFNPIGQLYILTANALYRVDPAMP